MRITEALRQRPGITAAGVIASTPANVDLLRDSGLWFSELSTATPNDIAIVVTAAVPDAVDGALAEGVALIDAAAAASTRTTYASVAAALDDAPANAIGFVAIPGSYAAAEARRVLESGRSVVVFSDNVSIEDELALKVEAHARGLLVMGPDAGTVLLGGLGLGFCNAVPPGRVGIVAASGTGAQAVASLLARAGEGVTSIVGLGSHDPSDEIGGISLFDALDALEADAGTEVIVLIAKAFGERTQARLLARLARMTTPVVTLSPGWSSGWITSAAGAHPAFTFADAADLACSLLDARRSRPNPQPSGETGPELRGRLVKGLFAGGTLAQEARAGLTALAAILGPAAPRIDVVDLGADEFTRGRPHPMIAPSIVAEALWRAGTDPDVGAVVFDVVLGYGAHLDPVSVLVPAVEALVQSTRAGGPVRCVAVVCGTEDDPQGLGDVRDRLVRAGATVVGDTTSAVAAILLGRGDSAPEPLGRWVASRPDAVVTIGTDWFADPLEAQGATVLHVDWRPSGGGDDDLNALLARLM